MLVMSGADGALVFLDGSVGATLDLIVILLVSPDSWNWSMPMPIKAAFSEM